MTDTHDKDAARGEFASLVAAYSKHGHALRQVADLHTGQPKYYASAWGYCKPLADLDEVRDFLQQIGGPSHASHD